MCIIILLIFVAFYLMFVIPMQKTLRQKENPRELDEEFPEEVNSPVIRSLPRKINPYHNEPSSILSPTGLHQRVYRQDYQIYKFNFASCCQAVAIILAFLMTVNSLIFLTFFLQPDPRPDWPSVLSWISFAESGFLILFSGLTIPKFTFTVKKTKLTKIYDPRITQLQFAFVHSLTYLLSGICMVGLSYLAYRALLLV